MQAALPQAAGEVVVASRPLVASLVRTLRDMQNEFGLDGGVSVADLVRFPGALERAPGAAGLEDSVRPGSRGCSTGRSRTSRARAGPRASGCASSSSGPWTRSRRRPRGSRSAGRPRASRALAALARATTALVAELGLEEARLYQEAVRAVERHDVTEELERLRSHVTAARELIAGDGAQAGQAPRLPGAGADARGQHDRQQDPGRGARSRRWWRSRPRSSASASRCRTLSERSPS